MILSVWFEAEGSTRLPGEVRKRPHRRFRLQLALACGKTKIDGPATSLP